MQFQLKVKETTDLRSTPEKLKNPRYFCNAEQFLAGVSNCCGPNGNTTKYFTKEANYLDHMKDIHAVVVDIKTPDRVPLKKTAGVIKTEAVHRPKRKEEPSMFAQYYPRSPTPVLSEPEDEEADGGDDQSQMDDVSYAGTTVRAEIDEMRAQIAELTACMKEMMAIMKASKPVASTPSKPVAMKKSVAKVVEEYVADDAEEIPTPVKRSAGRPKKVIA